jgi:hypothetical protein
MRLALPGQFSFVTFGDSDWARAYRPAVAVIRFERYREARRATYEVLVVLGAHPSWKTWVGNRSGLVSPLRPCA